MRSQHSLFAVCIAAATLSAPVNAQRTGGPACDELNAGIATPAGFCVTIFADSVGAARHILVAPNGDVFIAIANGRGGRGGVLALRDTNGDGRADLKERWGENGGNDLVLRGDNLYFATNDAILRYRLNAGQLTAAGAPDTLVRELPAVRSHTAKSIALGRGNELYVNIGSPSNVCTVQGDNNQGQDPCPELETRAGIWLFDTDKLNQRQSDGTRYATGLRNIVGLTSTPDGQVWGAQHGRDNLQSFTQYFDLKYGVEHPAEIFVRINKGDDYGWPYCFYDQDQKKQLLAPEYGGDGKQEGRCAEKNKPLVAFPGHWAPNDVLFKSDRMFPAKYRGGLFVAFHGSWNRAPEPQAGFNVTFVPFSNGRPAGNYEVFADFPEKPRSNAPHRPVGLAEGTDGSLYVTDDAGGRIYRIFYRGR